MQAAVPHGPQRFIDNCFAIPRLSAQSGAHARVDFRKRKASIRGAHAAMNKQAVAYHDRCTGLAENPTADLTFRAPGVSQLDEAERGIP